MEDFNIYGWSALHEGNFLFFIFQYFINLVFKTKHTYKIVFFRITSYN